MGYLSYEAVRYFERLPSPESDPLGLPESLFMLTPTFLIFDHLRHKIRVVSHAHLNGDIERAYSEAIGRIDELVDRLGSPLSVRGRSTTCWGSTRSSRGEVKARSSPTSPRPAATGT